MINYYVGWAKERERRAHHAAFESVGTLRFAHPTRSNNNSFNGYHS